MPEWIGWLTVAILAAVLGWWTANVTDITYPRFKAKQRPCFGGKPHKYHRRIYPGFNINECLKCGDRESFMPRGNIEAETVRLAKHILDSGWEFDVTTDVDGKLLFIVQDPNSTRAGFCDTLEEAYAEVKSQVRKESG